MPELYRSSARWNISQRRAYTRSPFCNAMSRPYFSMPRSSQMRRKTMQWRVRGTVKFKSYWVKSGFRSARLRASVSRQDSISFRKASSTDAVPFLTLLDSAYLSKEPFKTASRENIWEISSQRCAYSLQFRYRMRAVDDLSDLSGLTLQSYTANSSKSVSMLTRPSPDPAS